MFPLPKIVLKVSLRIGCGADAVTHCATPAATPSMARVTRNDGMRRNATRVPLMAPTTTPTARPARTPGTNPKSAIVMAAVTDESPAMEPTERSISAQAITNVMPTATTVMIAVCRRMFRRLAVLRKPSSLSRTAKVRNTTTNPT